ncbi:unnamed protein product [Sphagnum troendelagicum]
MQEGDINNPYVNIQEESTPLELEIKVIGKGNNAKQGMANTRIFEEKEVAETTMEPQTKFLEVTTSVLEKIDILVERAYGSIPAIHVNTNEEQIEEEMVVIGTKQPKKELEKGQEKGKAIYTEMVEKEVDKPSQVHNFKRP